MSVRRARFGLLAFLLALAGCGSQPRVDEEVPTVAQAVDKGWIAPPGAEELTPGEQDVLSKVLEPKVPGPDYTIRRADELNVKVVGVTDLSGTYRVGPDGSIGVPWAGTVLLEGLTRAEAIEALRKIYQPHFKTELTISVDVGTYAPMKVYVLGEVTNAKEVELEIGGTLLEALAAAGGLKREKEAATPGRAAISRGKEQVIWVDLDELLRKGNIALNVELQAGDVIYVPNVQARLAHVLGEVNDAGALEIGDGISLVEALAKAGGPSKDADLRMVFLVRRSLPGEYKGPVRADLKKLLETGDRSEDVELIDGDVLYVARNDLADVGYVLEHLQTFVSAATLIGLYTSPDRGGNNNNN
jgi:protein involved in polysaccharide export with SLBB domain